MGTSHTGSLRILVADDSDMFRSVMRDYLEPLAAEFLDASDGEEALALLEERTVDVALLDLAMPGIDGVELVRRMKGHRRRPKTVLITAVWDESKLEEARRVGADELLFKPIRPGTIRDTICRLTRAPT